MIATAGRLNRTGRSRQKQIRAVRWSLRQPSRKRWGWIAAASNVSTRSAASFIQRCSGRRPASRTHSSGVLATIARYAPPNLTVVGLDNEMFQITGGQATHTAFGTDLALVARGCGVAAARTVRSLDGFRTAFGSMRATPGPHVLVAKVDRQRSFGYRPRKGVLVKYRFMHALAWE